MGTPPRATWHLYVVRCADDTLYTGIATDVDRRLGEHRAGRGAKYLRGRGPLRVVYRYAIGARDAALRAEYRVKRMSRAEKERLVAQGDVPWLCHVCDRKFTKGDGDVCVECYRSTCFDCFDESNGRPRRCVACARGETPPDVVAQVDDD